MVAVMAHIFFEELITTRQILGGLLIITGLIVVSIQKYRENKAQQREQERVILAQDEEHAEIEDNKKITKKASIDKEHLLPTESELTDTSTDINNDADEPQVPLDDDYDESDMNGSFAIKIIDEKVEKARI
jgi:predicted membrane protein